MHKTLFTEKKLDDVYESPRIVYKGQLKQFAGSPLATDPDNGLLGLPGNLGD